MLQYFEIILTSVKDIDLLYKMRYILWVVAPLEACDVTKPGRHLGLRLGSHQEFEIMFIQTTLISKCVRFNGAEANRGIPRNLFRYPTDERLQQFASRGATIV